VHQLNELNLYNIEHPENEFVTSVFLTQINNFRYLKSTACIASLQKQLSAALWLLTLLEKALHAQVKGVLCEKLNYNNFEFCSLGIAITTEAIYFWRKFHYLCTQFIDIIII